MNFLGAVIFIQLYLFYFVFAQEAGDECVPNNEVTEGICRVLSDCAEAIRLIRKKNYHHFSRCGWQDDQEVLCCPTTSNSNNNNNKFGSSTTEGTRIAIDRKSERECQKFKSKITTPLESHIIGGEMALVGEFPHMVAIGFERDNGYEFDCGGSLVSRSYVLTAAHCIDTLDRIEPSIVRTAIVHIGGNEWDEETDVRISRIITHPSYKRREKYHDIALIRLEKQVTLNRNVNPACLYTGNDDPSGPLVITGWGQTSTTTEKRSSWLLKANVTTVPRDTCGRSYENWRKLPKGISQDQMCAGHPDGAMDTCQGDSGGPLQIQSGDGYRLVGITSFGRGCGSTVPGVYTKVSKYLDWIESVVWSN